MTQKAATSLEKKTAVATKKLVLVDGSSYLFRAFHALPPLMTTTGIPTGAIYGVVNMLRKLIKDEKPDYFAVIFDTKGKNFRHDLLETYKANRPEMAPELSVQIEPLHEVIRGMGLPLIAIEGVEADDVIATLAHQARRSNLKTVISTGDKDLAQLVDEQVICVNTMSGGVLDEKGVFAKFAVKPNQIVDYLTLIGDTVDNIPGVPKVGPKTAAKWLEQYGTLENLLEHANEITGKVGENLRTMLEQLPLSKKVITVRHDVPLAVRLETLVMQPEEVEKLKTLYEKLEFKSWLRELKEAPSEATASLPALKEKGKYELIHTETQFENWLKKLALAGVFTVDTETTGLDPLQAELVGVSFATEVGEAGYVPVGHCYTSCPEQLDRDWVLEKLKPLLTDPNIGKIGQHIKYDMHIFARYGIQLKNIAEDTMLESYVLNSVATRHDMAGMAGSYLQYTVTTYEEVAGKGAKQIPFSQVDVEAATQYSGEDADVTLRLHKVLSTQLTAEPSLYKVYRDIELPLVEVLWQMEENGICIDANKLALQSAEIAKELAFLEEQAYVLAGEQFNLASPKQLQEIFYEKLKLPILEKTPTGMPSTAESVLQELAHDYELPKLLLAHRTLSKLKSTYTDKLPQQINPNTGRIHTSYHQAVTATGRLSSTDPNLQNIPIRTAEGRKIRQAFVPAKGYKIVAADYSQIELRIMAHLSQDKGLLTAFQQGEDIHRYTASEVLGIPLEDVTPEQRRSAKAINFGLIYGMSAFGLARQLDIEREDAQAYMEQYFQRYPAVKQYMEDIRQQASQRGYVETLFGRRLYIPNIRSKNMGLRRGAERAAINAPMQGTAADIIKRAMIQLHKNLKQQDEIKMLLQVHDELVFEVKDQAVEKAKELIHDGMQNAANLSVPLVIDIGIGSNWDEAH